MKPGTLVYIVDDETFNRDIAARLIRKMGYDYREFPGGREVLDALADETPDIVLLDIHMPEINGLQVLEDVRKTLDKSDLPILMITADSEADTVVNAFEIGANDYVTKPINAKTLRARIETHLQLKAATQQIKEYTKGAENLVAQCTRDIQKRNEDLAREVRLRMDTEETLLQQKIDAERDSVNKSDFLARLSTQLKTPLNVAVGFAELVSREGPDALGHRQCHEYGGYILNSMHQLSGIVDDIWTISHHETGALTLDETEVEMATVVAQAIESARPVPSEKNISLQVDCPGGLFLRADAEKIERAIRNTLSNALRHTPQDGTCIITTSLTESLEIILEVSDQGPGAPENWDEMLSHPFSSQPVSESEQYADSLGIGLPAAKTVLDLHEATLTITNKSDHGTTVTFRFPAERTIIAAAASASA